MSRDLSDFYRSLTSDADARAVVAPEALRERADRRARVRATGTVLAAALLVAGVGTGTGLVLTGQREAVTPPAGTSTPVVTPPSPSPSATPGTPSPARTTPSRSPAAPPSSGPPPARTPTSIPDRAFFTQPAATTAMPPVANDDGKVLPDLCGADLDERVVQRRGRALFYHLTPDRPEGTVPYGTYRHTITIHRPGRADDWMADLRRAVRDCPEQEVADGGTSRQRLLPGGDFGDEAVLIEMREPASAGGEPVEGETIRLIRAIRVGDVVTVLWEMGWEGTSSDRRQVDDYSRRAVRAVSDWLD
ncbi:hypothetical protein AB0J20_14805 [Micromonospora costi]|uniref:hypothetical protein n=1 Tax=Micromonospora costi TaxID=1530042 RepID=UPI0033F1EB01